MNFTDLQASIGRIQLRRQAEFQKRRETVAACYLSHLPTGNSTIQFQMGLSTTGHARHLFVVRVPVSKMTTSRNELLLELRARNIGASVHYPPLHTLPLFRPYVRASLPNAEELMHDIITLPIGPSVTVDDATYVADQLLALIESAMQAK
jgi:dTDP-4-amino-4,6-dideoxygalactose transaminase